MTIRFLISTDGGATFPTVVTPAGVPQQLIEWSTNQSNGRASKRMAMAGPLVFSAKDDYQLLKALEGSEGVCGPVHVRIEMRCGGSWQPLWSGYYPAGGGGWDLDKCLFTIQPDPYDRFTCLEENWEVKQNILNTPAHTLNTVALPAGFEVFATQWPGLASPPADYGWLQVDTQSLTFPSGMGVCSGSSTSYQIYWRETVFTDCVNGVPVAPAGSGWVQLSPGEPQYNPQAPDCASENRTKWARQPLLTWPWPNDPIVIGPPATSGNPILEPTSPSCEAWFRFGILTCVGGFSAGLFLCLNDADEVTSIDTARRWIDVLQHLVDKSGCGVAGIRSDFFEWDPVGDAPGYASGINYVTGRANQVDQLIILEKSDAVDPDATQAATREELTLKDALRHMFTMFRVLWDIDDDGYLRIEHYSYWFTQPGVNVSDYTNIERRVYASLNDEVPRIERATYKEALGGDFVGKDIVYSGPCVKSGSDKEVEYGVGDIVADLSMILSDPSSVSRRGIVMVATTFNGSSYDTIMDIGAITNTPTTNAPLSWANLQRDFWTWDRYLSSGNMNGEDVTFDGFRPNVQQEAITLRCFGCDALDFQSDRTIGTRLGEAFGGVRGQVEKATLDRSGNLSLVLKYAR